LHLPDAIDTKPENCLALVAIANHIRVDATINNADPPRLAWVIVQLAEKWPIAAGDQAEVVSLNVETYQTAMTSDLNPIKPNLQKQFRLQGFHPVFARSLISRMN
jgi:hypothetical protein